MITGAHFLFYSSDADADRIFFRELPAGVPGAYRLFVNLLGQTPHVPAHD
jgi:hypothetical protein